MNCPAPTLCSIIEHVHSATYCAEIAEREEPSVTGTYINTTIHFAQRMRYGEAETSEGWMSFKGKKRAYL
jgi:hypothetical protein